MATAAVAAGSLIGGTALNLIGANQRVQAAKGAASAQERVAAQQLAFARESQRKALDLAQATPQELRQLEFAIRNQEQAVQRQKRLLDAIDPALLEVGKQALNLLKGQEASALKPLKEQRQRERQQLIQSLRETLGPGAEATAAGRKALREFDLQTNQQLQSAQQGTLQSFLNLSRSVRPNEFAGVNSALNIARGLGNIQSRQINALTGTAGLVNQGFAAKRESAGARFVGGALQGETLQGIGSALMSNFANIGKAFGKSGGTGSTGNDLISGGSKPIVDAGFSAAQFGANV